LEREERAKICRLPGLSERNLGPTSEEGKSGGRGGYSGEKGDFFGQKHGRIKRKKAVIIWKKRVLQASRRRKSLGLLGSNIGRDAETITRKCPRGASVKLGYQQVRKMRG